MTKTREQAEEARARAEDAVEAGKHGAAEVLGTIGSTVRRGSKKAAQMVESGGAHAADVLDEAKSRTEKGRSPGVKGYATKHPARIIFVVGLLAGAIAVFLIRRMNRDDAAEWDDWDA